MVRYLYFIVIFTTTTALLGCNENRNDTAANIKKTPEPVLVITNIVKPSAKHLYCKFMEEVLLHTLSISCTRAGASNASFLAPEKQNDDSTWTYTLIIPASATGGKYSVTEILQERYGIQKAAEYQSIYASCLKCPPVINTLLTSM